MTNEYKGLNLGGYRVHSPHIMVGLCDRKGKTNGGGGGGETSLSVKMGVSGTVIGHSGTDFVGLRNKGVSGTRYWRKNKNMRCHVDGRLAGTLRWPRVA